MGGNLWEYVVVVQKLGRWPYSPIWEGNRDGTLRDSRNSREAQWEVRVEQKHIKTEDKSSEPGIAAASRMSGVLQVKCLQENTVLLKRASEGATGYDLSAAYNCVIPSQSKEIV